MLCGMGIPLVKARMTKCLSERVIYSRRARKPFVGGDLKPSRAPHAPAQTLTQRHAVASCAMIVGLFLGVCTTQHLVRDMQKPLAHDSLRV